jgi:hypothetical protein
MPRVPKEPAEIIDPNLHIELQSNVIALAQKPHPRPAASRPA